MISALNHGERPQNLTFIAADYTRSTSVDSSASVVVSCFGSLEIEYSELASGISRLAAANADAIVTLWHEESEDLLSAEERWDVGVAEFDKHMVSAGWVLQHDTSRVLDASLDDGELSSLLHYRR
jgi:hypothetical protein